MLRYSRRRNKAKTGLPEVTLTPLIDTAFNLLIIFMVTAPMMRNAIKVDLPNGSVQEVKGVQDEFVVSIDKNGNPYLNGVATPMDKLVDSLRVLVAKQKDKMVIVKGDRVVSYGKVIEIVDRIKGVEGIRCVALETKKSA